VDVAVNQQVVILKVRSLMRSVAVTVNLLQAGPETGRSGRHGALRGEFVGMSS
jgi:hypothetical protein